MVKGRTHDKTNAAYPFEVNGESFIPNAGTRIKNGEARRFVVFVNNLSPDDLAFDTEPKAKLVSELKSASGSKLVFELVGQPNQSTLNVIVKKKGTEAAQTSSVPLIVQ